MMTTIKIIPVRKKKVKTSKLEVRTKKETGQLLHKIA